MAGTTNIGIALVLSAMDRASTIVNAFANNAERRMGALQQKTSAVADASFKAGKQMVTSGVAVAAPVLATVAAFADLEDAQLSLQSTMLNSAGQLSKEYGKIEAVAINLGNKLPGTTEDFTQMFQTMIENGGRARDIIQGTGKAAAYLGVQLKIPYLESGELMQRLQIATGVANKDMLAFADTLARVKQLGPSVQEMQSAFQRSAGELKTLKIQGLQATQQISNVYAMLIKTMGSGERVGTGFAAVLAGLGDSKAMAKFDEIQKSMGLSMRFMDRKGDFLGIENMMQQLDKMRALTTAQKNVLFTALAGSKGADNQIIATLVNEGMTGYRKMMAAQKDQADLNAKVELRLKGVKNQWDAVKGTMVNVAATIGKSLKPELDKFLKWANNMLPKVQAFIENHKTLVVWVLKAAIGFSALALAGGYISLVFGGIARGVSTVATIFRYGSMAVRGLNFAMFALRYNFVFKVLPALSAVGNAFKWLRVVMLANPVILIIAAVAAAAYLIYRNWGPIKNFFGKVWDGVTSIFKKAYNFIFNMGQPFQNAGKNIVMSIAKGIFSVATLPVRMMMAIVKKIRAFLPFSPAKEGPLKDIHRIKLVETIAMSLKPAALINAWRNTLSSFRGAVAGGGGAVQAVAPMGGGGGGVHIVMNITLNGGATAKDANMLEDAVKKAMDKWYRDKLYNQQRVSFG